MKIDISIFNTIRPFLESCFGFNIQEITTELSNIYDKQVQEDRFDKELAKKHSYTENEYQILRTIEYVLETKDKIIIATTQDFKKVAEDICSLCRGIFEQDEISHKNVACTLVFMAAILNRNNNGLSPSGDIDEFNWIYETYTSCVRPDLLHLYVARHKGGNSYHKSCHIRFGNDAASVEIQQLYPWFEKMLDRYLNKYLGVKNINEAEKELQQIYGKKVGAQFNKTVTRFIWGTYHLLQNVPNMKSTKQNSVTNEQSRFIHEYLVILGLIDPVEVEASSIRGRLNNLLKKYSAIDEVLDKRLYKTSPNNDNDWELF